MANIEDARIIEQFKNIVVERLEDVLLALPALIPQTEEDKRLFKRGMTAIENLAYDIKHSNNPREIGRYIDVQKVLQDFNEESIRTLSAKLSSSAKSSIDRLSEIAKTLQGEEDDD